MSYHFVLPHTPKIFVAFAACWVWLTLLLRLYIGVQLALAQKQDAWFGVMQSFGYFTVLTTLLIALVLTVTLFPSLFVRMRFLVSPSVITAVTTSIILVGLVYVLVLRKLWQPQGLRYLVDISLHYIIPFLFLFFWWMAVPAASLRWLRMWPWLWYPIIYLCAIFLRGYADGFYPYPFLDINELGLLRTLINSAILLAFFIFISVVLIAVNQCRKSGR